MNMDLFNDDVQRILLAALCGAAVGIEREWSGKSAGIRTMMLVCIGSALFTIISFKMALLDPREESDVTRIASNIVSGIGFIGAGLIFKSEKSIHGLTTAATVWAAAAIGIAIGNGNYATGLITTAVVLVVLTLVNYVESALSHMIDTREYHVRFRLQPGNTVPAFEEFFAPGFRLIDSKCTKDEDGIRYIWTVSARKNNHEAVIRKLVRDERVIDLSY